MMLGRFFVVAIFWVVMINLFRGEQSTYSFGLISLGGTLGAAFGSRLAKLISATFDGSNIEQKVISLGYILMDDASGNYFGRQLLRDYYFNKIPNITAKKCVEVGDKIKKGQTVMIVEAMKTMNHVPSTSDGVIKKILIEDGQPVEFGQTLILLK